MISCLVELFFFICFKRIRGWLLNHFYVASLKALTDTPNMTHLIVIESWLSFLIQIVIFLILGTSDLLLHPRQFPIVLGESVSCFMTLFGCSVLIDIYSELWFSGRLMFRALQDYVHQLGLCEITEAPTWPLMLPPVILGHWVSLSWREESIVSLWPQRSSPRQELVMNPLFF